jgi:hypothetical protein
MHKDDQISFLLTPSIGIGNVMKLHPLARLEELVAKPLERLLVQTPVFVLRSSKLALLLRRVVCP